MVSPGRWSWLSRLSSLSSSRWAVLLQWLLDCLACLLKLICQFAVDPADLDLAYHDVFSWSGLTEGQRKRAWQGKSRKSTVEHGKGLHVPRLTEVDAPPSRPPPAGTSSTHQVLFLLAGLPGPGAGHQPDPASYQRGLHLRQPGPQVSGTPGTPWSLLVLLLPLTASPSPPQGSEGPVGPPVPSRRSGPRPVCGSGSWSWD